MRILSITTRLLAMFCILATFPAAGERLYGPGDDPAQ